MILCYIDSKGKPFVKIISKFWQGLSGIKFQFETGQVIEIQGVEKCFIYEGNTVQQESGFK